MSRLCYKWGIGAAARAAVGIGLWLAVVRAASGETLLVPDEFPTLRDAAQMATDGDTILVAAGIYDQLGQSTSIRSGVTLRSESGREATSLVNFDHGGLAFVHNNGIETPSRLIGFTILDGAHAIRHNTIVENNRIVTPYYGWISWWATLSSSCTFRNNIIEGDAEYRFIMFPDPPAPVVWTFEGNLITQPHAFASFGYIGGTGTQRLILRDNTCINFQGLDLGPSGESTIIEVVNNIFYGTGGDDGYAELWCSGDPNVHYDIRYNAWWRSRNVSCTYGTGNIFVDPVFCDPSEDYRLHASSPCIGSGEGGATIGAYGVGCGVASISPTESSRAPWNIRVIPNPTRVGSVIEYESAGVATQLVLSLYGADGRLITRQAVGTAPGARRLRLAELTSGKTLPAGVYYLELRDVSRRVASTPLVVLR